MEFHEWQLTPDEAMQIRELNRFAQVWSAEGKSLLRSQFATEDLPLDTTALRGASAGTLYPLERLSQLSEDLLALARSDAGGAGRAGGKTSAVASVPPRRS